MKDDSTPSLREPEILFTTCLGLGFLPKAPGTWASLATLPLLWFLGRFSPPVFIFIPFMIILTVAAIVITELTQKKHQVHDPSWIVIDEFIGMLVTWLFLRTDSLWQLALIFFVFRFFDIIKFWPANYFDIKVKHGYGTIVDDIVSGIYAGGLCLLIVTLSKNIF